MIDRLIPAFHQPVSEKAQHRAGRESQRGDLPAGGIGDADRRVDRDLGQGTAPARDRDHGREMTCR